MDIRNYKEIRSFAFSRLENCHDRHKIVSIYAAVVIGLSVLSAAINLFEKCGNTNGHDVEGYRRNLAVCVDALSKPGG